MPGAVGPGWQGDLEGSATDASQSPVQEWGPLGKGPWGPEQNQVSSLSLVSTSVKGQDDCTPHSSVRIRCSHGQSTSHGVEDLVVPSLSQKALLLNQMRFVLCLGSFSASVKICLKIQTEGSLSPF